MPAIGIAANVGDLQAESRLGGRMIQWLVLPLALLTFVNAIDRANMSFAGDAMSADLGLTPGTFGIAVAVFFAAYLLFQYPHAELLRRFGMRRWLLVSVTLWGVAGVAMSQVHSVGELYAARFLLGAAEAGFAPGVTWYINRWLPAGTRARAMATVLSAVPFSIVVAGPLCGWMLGEGNPLGLAPWRWMFLIQSIPNFILAMVAYFYFHDDVTQSRWLSADERRVVVPSDSPPSERTAGAALRDPRVWRCALVWLFVMTGSYALLFWLPQLVRPMMAGASELMVGMLAVLPQAGLILGMTVNGWHSDHSGERRWHMGVAAVLAGVLLFTASLAPSGWPALGLLIASGIGIGAAQSVFWAVPAALGIGGGRVSVAAIAFISMAGTLGGIVGPMLIGFVRQATGSFAAGLWVLSALLVLAGLAIVPFGRRAP